MQSASDLALYGKNLQEKRNIFNYSSSTSSSSCDKQYKKAADIESLHKNHLKIIETKSEEMRLKINLLKPKQVSITRDTKI